MSDTDTTDIDNQVDTYPVLPLRDVVVYPHMVIPLFVGRAKSIHALENAMAKDRKILLVTQKSANEDEPEPEDLYGVGTVATILQLLKLPDETIKVLVEGGQRTRILEFFDTGEMFTAETDLMHPAPYEKHEIEILVRSVVEQFEQYTKLNKKVP
ncbi:MAG: LON peptidase substrate-binding domain-containing protein, partial [Pseudomonadota bacterium]